MLYGRCHFFFDKQHKTVAKTQILLIADRDFFIILKFSFQ